MLVSRYWLIRPVAKTATRNVTLRNYTTGHKTFGDYVRSPTTKLMLMLTFISSELAYILKKQNEMSILEQRAATQLDLMKLLKDRVLLGEAVDVDHELNLVDDNIDKTVDDILRDLNEADQQWAMSKKRIVEEEVAKWASHQLAITDTDAATQSGIGTSPTQDYSVELPLEESERRATTEQLSTSKFL